MASSDTVPRPAERRIPARSTTGVAIFGCDADESALFRSVAERTGMRVALSPDPLREDTVGAAAGFRCVSVDHRTPLSEPVLRALADAGVAYVSTRSIGVDHIDGEAAADLGITVGNVGYSPGSVADFTILLMLMLLRDAASIVRRVDADDYRTGEGRGRELSDLTVGVIGTGRIGSAVVQRLRGFGCAVLTHDRRGVAGRGQVPLDELLERSDLATLHVPLTAETRQLLGRDRLALLPRGAYLVNTARGGLVDTGALIDALESGRLGGAALDVVEGEGTVFHAEGGRQADRAPDPVHVGRLRRLQRLRNVVITPHTAYFTDRALRDVVDATLANCRDFEERGPSWDE